MANQFQIGILSSEAVAKFLRYVHILSAVWMHNTHTNTQMVASNLQTMHYVVIHTIHKPHKHYTTCTYNIYNIIMVHVLLGTVEEL